MATPTLAQAHSHYDRQQRIVVGAVLAVRSLFRRRRPLSEVAATVAAYQAASATASANTMAGWAGARQALTVPEAFSGVSSLGFPVIEPIIAAIDRVHPAPAEAMPEAWWADMMAEAAADTQRILEQLVASEVADAGRTASQVEFVTRPTWQNYVRMLQPPSCPRCAILAGRIYRDLEAFARHPQCDCVMVPVQDWESAHDGGLVSSFKQLFDAGQVRGLSKADTKAIQDGADPAQVINATRGLSQPGLTAAYRTELFGRTVKATSEGTTQRAAWRRANPTRLVRLRPETIYEIADGDRDEARRLLELYGYIAPDDGSGRTRGREDSEPQTASGDGGSGNPPTPPVPPTPAVDPPDDDKAAWKVRQDATGLDFKGDLLKPWEVRAVERLTRRGETIEWIKNDPSTSNSDFVWRGEPFELKSTKARAETIHGRIVDAASRAWLNHGVEKTCFIIDLGHERLTDEVRDALSEFNVGRRLYRLKQLWVMSQDGSALEEIRLRK